ncbi:DUF433 domain-containing protein [Lacihabitans sp. LS3-19]|uniref:DUF433 domain-containing protein n=1 Tax=Lacihabitans sp. LS3-19 TaxID=2487335 RepID=UPI0020CF9C15|nr:DUF433 domain-containing protein [Lacihabitans sp. LS3-19]MCP9766499.1 DUF433 domain-containing protein [Lacihabitans sp. LS3-19]
MIANSNLISIDSQIRFRTPCISGTRIAVSDVLRWLASGMTHAEILKDFPQLTEQAIFTALAFSANRESMILTILT